MANSYDVGDLVRVSWSYTNLTTGALTDPATIGFNYRPGNSTTVTKWVYGTLGSIVRDSVGDYHADLDTTDAPGTWKCRAYSTGLAQTAADSTFIVLDSEIK